MQQQRFELSGYKGMWLFAMFDLPTDTTEDIRNYTRFRKTLLQLGFDMLQFSVYARYCADEDASKIHRKRVRQALPPKGHVRVLAVTDHQFGKMEVYMGKKTRTDRAAPRPDAPFIGP